MAERQTASLREWQKLFTAYMLCWGGDTANQSHSVSLVDYQSYNEELFLVVARQWLPLLFRFFKRYTATSHSRIHAQDVLTGLTLVCCNDRIPTETLQRWATVFPAAGKKKTSQLLIVPFPVVLAWMKTGHASALVRPDANQLVVEPESKDDITEADMVDIGKALGLVTASARKIAAAIDRSSWEGLAAERNIWSRPWSKEHCDRPAVRQAQAIVNQEVFGRSWADHITTTHTGIFWAVSTKPLLSYVVERSKRKREEAPEPAVGSPKRAKVSANVIAYERPTPTSFPPPIRIPCSDLPRFHPLWWLPAKYR